MKLSRFAAVQIENHGQTLFVSGIGGTPTAAVKDAKALTDVTAGLHVLPITHAARHCIEQLGGDKNKAVTLAVITHAELRALEMLREIDATITTAYAQANGRH